MQTIFSTAFSSSGSVPRLRLAGTIAEIAGVEGDVHSATIGRTDSILAQMSGRALRQLLGEIATLFILLINSR
jgi:hypothetical protein